MPPSPLPLPRSPSPRHHGRSSLRIAVPDCCSVYTCLESDVQSVEAPAVDSTYSSSSASGSEPSSPAQLSVDSGHNDEGLTGSPSATTDCNTNSSSICSSGSSANSSSPQIDETGQADGSYPALPPPSTIYSVIPAVAKSGEALTLIGSGFGEDRAVVRVMVGGRECRDPELCHRVCRPCDDKHPCDFDEMCMQDDLSKNKVCFEGKRIACRLRLVQLRNPVISMFHRGGSSRLCPSCKGHPCTPLRSTIKVVERETRSLCIRSSSQSWTEVFDFRQSTECCAQCRTCHKSGGVGSPPSSSDVHL